MATVGRRSRWLLGVGSRGSGRGRQASSATPPSTAGSSGGDERASVRRLAPSLNTLVTSLMRTIRSWESVDRDGFLHWTLAAAVACCRASGAANTEHLFR